MVAGRGVSLEVRGERLQALLRCLDADALLVVAKSSADPDLAAFIGAAHLGQSFLLWRPGAPPLLGYLVDMERDEASGTGLELTALGAIELADLRRRNAPQLEIWLGALVPALEARGLEGGRIALAGHPPAGEAHAITRALVGRGFDFVDGQQLVRSLRKRKAVDEIREIKSAARGTCAAFRRVAGTLAGAGCGGEGLTHEGEPLTAGVLRAQIAVTLAEHGLGQPEGNIVACGTEAGVPHTRGADDRRLRVGEAVVVDLYPRGRLFADCTRTFCVGEPGEDLARAHDLCRRGLEAASAASSPGVAGWDLQRAVCDLFEAQGHPTARSSPGTRTGYVHGLGHGVGFELHELPSFRAGQGGEGELEPGDVFTLEPGLYDPRAGWGVRLEDLLVMTDEGAENLTPLPYDLDPRAWRE